MKARCINFKKGQKTKETKYFIKMDGLNKIGLYIDDDFIYLDLNDKQAAKIDYDDFMNNISNFIYEAIQKDIFEFYFTDIEFYRHFQNVNINWLKAF